MKYTCDYCKEEFNAKNRRIWKHKFCSRECYLKWRGCPKKRNYREEHIRRKDKEKEYKEKNREKILVKQRECYHRTKEINKEKRRKNEHSERYRKMRREYMKNRRDNNVKIKIDNSMSSMIYLALKAKKNGRCWEELVGYTLNDLIKHLESQFDDKMSWDNYGGYWWIDHIKARSLFKYETAEDQKFEECWALENLQPLEKIANIVKGNTKDLSSRPTM